MSSVIVGARDSTHRPCSSLITKSLISPVYLLCFGHTWSASAAIRRSADYRRCCLLRTTTDNCSRISAVRLSCRYLASHKACHVCPIWRDPSRTEVIHCSATWPPHKKHSDYTSCVTWQFAHVIRYKCLITDNILAGFPPNDPGVTHDTQSPIWHNTTTT